MTSFFRYLTNRKIPRFLALKNAIKHTSTWQGGIFLLLLCTIPLVLYISLFNYTSRFFETIPVRGGSITEGVIGAPRMLNPVLATTETDTSINALLFRGLTKQSENEYTMDLAESVAVSPDKKMYTFTLRDHLAWSDGKPLTAQDVVFTYKKRALFEPNSFWQEKIITALDDRTVQIVLQNPDETILQETTLGIIPEHIWGSIRDDVFEDSPYNLSPIGSGVFSFERAITKHGVVTELLLSRNRHFYGKKSYLDQYRIVFFANQHELSKALDEKNIDITTYATPETASEHTKQYQTKSLQTTTRVGIFSSTQASYPEILSFINAIIDKQQILATIQYGYGILPDTASFSLEEARATLHTLGYTTSPDGIVTKKGFSIGFSLAVENDQTLVKLAQVVADAVQKYGITIVVKAFDPGIFQDTIDQHEYQFFLGKRDTRISSDQYRLSIPFYTDVYPLMYKKGINLIFPTVLTRPSDKYSMSEQWYVRTNRVWHIFAK